MQGLPNLEGLLMKLQSRGVASPPLRLMLIAAGSWRLDASGRLKTGRPQIACVCIGLVLQTMIGEWRQEDQTTPFVSRMFAMSPPPRTRDRRSFFGGVCVLEMSPAGPQVDSSRFGLSREDGLAAF